MLVLRNLFHILLPTFRQENFRLIASQIRPMIVGTISPDESNTIPINLFSIEDGNTFVLVCRENNQVIRIPHSEMSKVFGYYDKHAQHIARLDCMFRSRR